MNTRLGSSPNHRPTRLTWARESANQAAPSFLAWVFAGLSTGLAFALADFVVRLSAVGVSPDGWAWRQHVPTTLTMYGSLGVLFGFTSAIISKSSGIFPLIAAPFGLLRSSRALAAMVPPLFGAAIVVLWFWTASFTPPIDLIDWVALLWSTTAIIAIIALAPLWMPLLARRPRFRLLVAVGAILVGALVSWLDMTVLVSLYPFMHAVAELMTGALWLFAFHCFALDLLNRRFRLPGAILTACLLVFAMTFQLSGGQAWAAQRLRHTATHHAYAGRLLARANQMPKGVPRSHRRLPNQPVSLQSSSRQDERPADACPSAWWPAESPVPSPTLRAAIPANPNIVVFFVDSLRHDVASDPRVMPNLARFASKSLDFSKVYSTGSDTRSVLPAVTRGSYDLARQDDYDLLKVARNQGLQLTLAIGSSPRKFLEKHVPQFSFDEVLETEDADPERKVWGYGAHRQTAKKIVDDSLSWLSQSDRKRFFLWLFHFDLHAWREMEDSAMAAKAKAFGIPKSPPEVWKYKTVAATIDAEFGRFLLELEAQGLADDTVVLFFADHGEGLGRQGFWLHSVFLWESLIHIPLILHVPGVDPRVIDSTVSTMDIGPTLIRLIDPAVSMLPYHGEDLLMQLESENASRRFPILMRSVIKEQVARLGVMDPSAQRKLVLPLESGQPELYDMSARAPDDVDIALEEPATVQRLLPIVSDGPMNPQTWRKHERCHRFISQPEQQVETLATESRRVNRVQPWTAEGAKTGGPS